MKSILINLTVFVILSIVCSCRGSEGKKSDINASSKDVCDETEVKCGVPEFEFTKEIHKFGTLLQGEIVVCSFYYKNVGKGDLIISHVESSCGCTEVRWDKSPLPPGEESKIVVEFDSKGRYGRQYKTVSIFANIPEKIKELVIMAQVE